MIDSSPSSAESSFRELDEVFLQTQTRIWLGEVLNARFDEELHISDLLQDGEILFEVSKVVWNSLLTKCMELRHLRHKHGPFGSKKSSGRYRPYSNVDSFLKDKRKNSLNILAESIPDGRKGANSQLPPVKPDRKPLLKTVVKGTAIAGVLFLLLHIGRKSKGNNAEETKQYAQVSRYSGSKSSSTKQRAGSVGKGIYPTEKIKL
ncbi:UNVERIFIED_CONTAM: protein OPAQUE10 [Sesamum calycinum]|uniref:Protein OPAQUE10 n=1 Tax=Sesamum calycinum TaxID=2727403 RepID=A0AAW2MLZ6_9LAMI